jgi:hypothetical protein
MRLNPSAIYRHGENNTYQNVRDQSASCASHISGDKANKKSKGQSGQKLTTAQENEKEQLRYVPKSERAIKSLRINLPPIQRANAGGDAFNF